MKRLIKQTFVYDIDDENEAAATVEEFKNEQLEKGYTVLKSKIDYKVKKDRKTGEIVDENWKTEVTIAYEV